MEPIVDERGKSIAARLRLATTNATCHLHHFHNGPPLDSRAKLISIHSLSDGIS
jgi:hypothetical protein